MGACGHRKGQCDQCRVCWTWTIGVKLKDQICLTCYGPLRRVNAAGRDKANPDGRHSWMTWEGYQP